MKKLLYLQIKENGISPETFLQLSSEEKSMLESKHGRYFLLEKYKKNFSVVATGGVFDILHAGHIFTLNEAKKHGNFLVVIIARDELIRKKNRNPMHTQEQRAYMVESLKAVDLALLGGASPRETFEQINPDVIVYGYDQEPFLTPQGVKIVKLTESYGNFKTNKIIKELGL